MTYTPNVEDTMPVPVEPAVLGVHLIGPQTATTDVLVYIPWKHCRLAYAYTVTTVAEGNVNAVNIDLELNSNAAGQNAMEIDVAQNAAVGDIDEATIITAADCKNLNRDDTSRDAINIELTSAGNTSWQGMLYMYFERDIG